MFFRYVASRTIVLLTFLAAPLLSQSTPNASPSPAPSAAIAGRFIVAYRAGVLPADSEVRARLTGARVLQRHDRLGIAVVQASSAATGEATRRSLAADPGVEFVLEDRMVAAHAISTRAATLPSTSSAQPDALYNSPQGWAVRQVGGFGDASHRGPWNVTRGAGARIAILDSGVDANHPDIAPNLVLNLSEVDQSVATGLPSPCDDGSAQDQQGHGTWSASLAAGAMGANTGQIVGVAPEASILNIKVLERMPATSTSTADPTGCNAGQAYGLLSWVLAGIADAINHHADIISMSLGTLVDITTGQGAGLQVVFDRITRIASNAGVIMIAAAGNDGYDLGPRANGAIQPYIELPAQSRGVVALLASSNPDCAENLAANAACTPGPVTLPYYSNYGSSLDGLAAPGGSYPAGVDTSQSSGWIWGACSSGISSTLSGPPADSAHSFGCFGLGHAGYVQAMGTSASAPLAAGVAALIRAANPTWDAPTVIAALRKSATVLPSLPAPLVNAAAIVSGARLNPHPHPVNNPGASR